MRPLQPSQHRRRRRLLRTTLPPQGIANQVMARVHSHQIPPSSTNTVTILTILCCLSKLELSWVHILLPGYPLTNTRRVPGYPFIRCRMFPALNQDLDWQHRPTTSQAMSTFLHQSLWNLPLRAYEHQFWDGLSVKCERMQPFLCIS